MPCIKKAFTGLGCNDRSTAREQLSKAPSTADLGDVRGLSRLWSVERYFFR